MADEEPDDGAKKAAAASLGLLASVVAGGLVVVYLVFVSLQWFATDAEERTWTRRSELLTGLEVLAFTAAGALLGTTVQRQVTRQVEYRAEQAEAAAARESRDAEKGRALHRAITARAQAGGATPSAATRGGAPPPQPDPWAEMVELARSYDEAD